MSIEPVVVAVPSLDPPDVDRERIETLKTAELKAFLAFVKVPVPGAARKPDLLEFARNWFEIEALRRVKALAPDEPAVEVGAPPDAVPTPDVVEVGGSVIPAPSRWQQIVGMAEYFAKSNLIPKALIGRPNDVGVILVAANDLRIPMTAAFSKLYVIDGKIGQEAELMRLLIFREGHQIGVRDEGPDYCTMYGKRVDTGQEETATFRLSDALAAGLIESIDRDGRPVPRRGKDVWRAYTSDMLCARATARLARRLFPDCLGGVSYTPDELGYIDAEPADQLTARGRAGEAEPTMTLHQHRDELANRIQDLDDDVRDELKDEWKRRNLPPLAQASAGALRTIQGLIETAEAVQATRQSETEAGIEDAETVEENPPADPGSLVEGPCAMCGSTDPEPGLRAVDSNGRVRCLDTHACLARVEAAARDAVEAPQTPLDGLDAPAGPDVAETPAGGAPGPVGAVCVAVGCDAPAEGDLGLCAEHAEAPF